jgi:hypothetical protein
MSASERDQKITAIVKKLDKTPAKEHIPTLLRAAIEAIPCVGGTFSTLIEELIPNWKMERLQRFVAELAVDLESLAGNIDLGYLRREEFGYLFEETFRIVLFEYREEKLAAFRNILLNSMVRTDVKQELKEYLFSTVRDLGSLHMRFIALLENPREFYGARGVRDDASAIGGSIIEELRRCFPELDDPTIRAVWNDLRNSEIVSMEARNLGAMISSSGSKALEGHLTEFGRLLTSFIRSPR